MKKAYRDKVRSRLDRVRAVLAAHERYLHAHLDRNEWDALAQLLDDDVPALLDELDRQAAAWLAGLGRKDDRR